MTPKISIVIASYNDPFVEKAVESALEQDYENKEIILVDDGSKGQFKALTESLRDRVDLFIQQPNSGQSIARNNAIKKAGGKYILNHDSDDFFETSFCSEAVEVLENNKEVKIVTCKANRIFEKKKIDVYIPGGGTYENFLFANAALGSSMFRRAGWEEVGGYEEELPILGFEDWELYLNILKRGGTAYVIDEVLFNYRLRPNSITRRISNLRNEKFKHIILKHQELYIHRFESTINNLFSRMENMQKDISKIKEGPDYKTGKRLLGPFRFLKRKL